MSQDVEVLVWDAGREDFEAIVEVLPGGLNRSREFVYLVPGWDPVWRDVEGTTQEGKTSVEEQE